MYCVKKMTEDLYWVGASDRRLALFENVYPISRGVSYNSYLLLDEKTVLLDTADSSVSGIFFENVEHVLNGRPLDYLIVNHMEPDHFLLQNILIAQGHCTGKQAHRQQHQQSNLQFIPLAFFHKKHHPM